MGAYTWTPQTSAFGTDAIWEIAYNGSDLWVAVGADSKLATSPNGKTWTLQDVSAIFGTGDNIQAVAHNQTDMWVIGSQGIVATSPDGVNWTERIPDVIKDFINVCYGNGLWILISSGSGPVHGTIQTSSDGITWQERVNTGTYLYDVAYDEIGGLYAIANYDSVLTSPDGIIWTNQSFGFTMYPLAIAHNQTNLWIAGANDEIATSSDGINWVYASMPDTNTLDVAFGGGRWMIGGTEGVSSSSDGVTWENEPIGTISTIFGIAHGSNMWIVVGASATLVTGETIDSTSTRDHGTNRKTFWLNRTAKK